MSYSELFDGEEHWLGLGLETGWTKPYLQVTDVVEVDPQPRGLTHLEAPVTNHVSVPVSPAAEASWAVENGWSAFAVMIRYIGELLSPGGENLLDVEQLVVRDERTWAITSTHYRVLWKGDEVEGI
jgi:hypothetical protein